MTQMTKVQAIKTTDGKLFEDAGQAADHQAQINMKEGLEKFADEHFYNGMDRESVINIITSFRKELLAIIDVDVKSD